MSGYATTILGELSLIAIFVLSCWAIYSPQVDDGLIGRLLYCVMAVVSLGGMIHMVTDTVPKTITVTLLACVAVHMLRDIFSSHFEARVTAWWTRLRVDAQRRNSVK